MLTQRLSGIGMILASFWFADLVSGGISEIERDGGGALLLFVIGVILLFSKRKVLMSCDDYS